MCVRHIASDRFSLDVDVRKAFQATARVPFQGTLRPNRAEWKDALSDFMKLGRLRTSVCEALHATVGAWSILIITQLVIGRIADDRFSLGGDVRKAFQATDRVSLQGS